MVGFGQFSLVLPTQAEKNEEETVAERIRIRIRITTIPGREQYSKRCFEQSLFRISVVSNAWS
jgi:hypothetical protein